MGRMDSDVDDLVEWGVLEADDVTQLSQRFRGALARAAATLQTSERAGHTVAGDPLTNQVEVALATFVGKQGEVEERHIALVRRLHRDSLPSAVRDLLGA